MQFEEQKAIKTVLVCKDVKTKTNRKLKNDFEYNYGRLTDFQTLR